MVAYVCNPDAGEAGRQTPGAHCTGGQLNGCALGSVKDPVLKNKVE